MKEEFNPTFGMPKTVEEALQVLEEWGSENVMTFNSKRATAMAKLFREALPSKKEKAPKKPDRAFILKALHEAQSEAAEATRLFLNHIGGDRYPCGFAWVNIKPARGPWVAAMKDLQMGRIDDYYGGYTIWNPSLNGCQNMDAKEAGARAFAMVLRKYGVEEVSVGTRLD